MIQGRGWGRAEGRETLCYYGARHDLLLAHGYFTSLPGTGGKDRSA